MRGGNTERGDRKGGVGGGVDLNDLRDYETLFCRGMSPTLTNF